MSAWREIVSDEEFYELFKGKRVIDVSALAPLHDVVWSFDDGSRLAMDVPRGDGCPTCGFGNEPSYYIWESSP